MVALSMLSQCGSFLNGPSLPVTFVETLHRAAAEGACAGKEDVVGTRPGDVKEEATFSVHTKAASEANLVPGAA